MDIEFGMKVVDKSGKEIGTIGKIFMDTWTGKPRKYMVVRVVPHAPDELFMVPPERVGEVAAGTAKLNVSIEELVSAADAVKG